MAAVISGGALPLGYARATIRANSDARLAHSITPSDCGGGGGGGAAASAPATSHACEGRLRCSAFSSSSRWCASWNRLRTSFSSSRRQMVSAPGLMSLFSVDGRVTAPVRCSSSSVSRSFARNGKAPVSIS